MDTIATPAGPVTFALIPGAGGQAWYWHRLAPELEARGHAVVPIDLPADDDDAGLADYLDTIVGAIGDRTPVAVVAQSMGGLVAPLVGTRRPVDLLVLVNAMIPSPGETGGAWWAATGQADARSRHATAEGRRPPGDVDPYQDFLHDLPEHVRAEALRQDEVDQSARPFADPFPLDAWPDVPTHVIAGRDDRFFPATFQAQVAVERLGIVPEVIPGGHLLALANPEGLADRLHAAWQTVAPTGRG